MRIVQKSAIRKALFNYSLCLFGSEACNVYIIDKRQIDVTIVADASFSRKLWDVIHAEFQQIANSQPQRGIRTSFRSRLLLLRPLLGIYSHSPGKNFRWLRRLLRDQNGRCSQNEAEVKG